MGMECSHLTKNAQSTGLDTRSGNYLPVFAN
jgi:hypothetical protein